MKSPCFEVYKSGTIKEIIDTVSKSGLISRQTIPGKPEWRWRLKGANGEIVAQGESFTRKADAMRAVRCIKRLAPEAIIKP